MPKNTIFFEDPSIAPLLAMLRAKNNAPRTVASRKVVYLDELYDSRRPVAPHLIFANELLAAYPGFITDKDFDFRDSLGYLVQFSLSQTELTESLRTGKLYITSDQGNEVCFPVEDEDVTQLVADCITIRELASGILPAEIIAVRMRQQGFKIDEVRRVLEQADLCRIMMKRTVVSIIEAFMKSGQDFLSPLEIEALMSREERAAIAAEVREEMQEETCLQ